MKDPKIVAKELTEKISKAQNILIISSRPADQDSIGTNLSMQWFIKKFANKSAESIIFSDPLSTERLKSFPNINEVKYHNPREFDFGKYDLIILVDGAHWDMFLGDNWQEVKKKINTELVYVIDHHPRQGFQEIENQLIIRPDCCTAKLVYDYFIKEKDIDLEAIVATWMYYALIDDTGRFIHELQEDTFDFASVLYKAGANHIGATDENMSIEEMKMMNWCIDNTEFVEDIKTTILVIDQQRNDELEELFGSNWAYKKLYRAGYVEKIERKITGYDYAVIFTYRPKDNTVHAGWRTRTNGGIIPLQEVLTAIGFEAGGHFGAGGGVNATKTIEKIVEDFKFEMERRIKSL